MKMIFKDACIILVVLLCLFSSYKQSKGNQFNRINNNLSTNFVKSDQVKLYSYNMQPGSKTAQTVIESITDETEQSSKTIYLPPGIYDFTNKDIVLNENTHIRGFSPGATIIETGNGHSIIAASNCSINDLTIRYRGAGYGAITDNSRVEYFTINRVDFDINGNNAAIYFTSGASNKVWMYDVKIVTEGTGIYTTTWGHYYLHDVDIFLTGENIGSPHIGIQINSGSRFYIWGSKIGTGYGYPEISNDIDQDVVGIYIPSYNKDNPRIEIHGLESFCRNAGAFAWVNVNVIRAEAGWVRCFGCFGQSETPPQWEIGRTLYQSDNGKIEVYGSRFSSFTGAILGSPQRGVSFYNKSHDGYELSKFEGGLILLDAMNGPFTLFLDSYPSKGQEYIFKKVDSSANKITISGENLNSTIDGELSKDLTSQYETLRIIGGYGQWHTY